MENLTQFALGSGHVCVIHSLNQVYCWGANGSGQANSPTNDLFNNSYSINAIMNHTDSETESK